MSTAWLEHVKNYYKEHPDVSYKKCMTLAKESYKSTVENPKTRTPKTDKSKLKSKIRKAQKKLEAMKSKHSELES